MAMQVCAGAILKCGFGAAPSADLPNRSVATDEILMLPAWHNCSIRFFTRFQTSVKCTRWRVRSRSSRISRLAKESRQGVEAMHQRYGSARSGPHVWRGHNGFRGDAPTGKCGGLSQANVENL